MRGTVFQLTALMAVTILFIIPFGSQAEISASIDAEVKANGQFVVAGTAKVFGFEASLVRTAIDSPFALPDTGSMGTGNGDGNVNMSEVEDYSNRLIESGSVRKVFERDIIKVELDGDELPATLRSLVISGAEGNVSTYGLIEVTFKVNFDMELDEDVNQHKVAVSLTFDNITYDLRFEVPEEWDIGAVKGLRGHKVVNDNGMSYVSGEGTGDGTPVEIQVGRDGGFCCIVLMISVISIVLIVLLVYRRHRKKKDMRIALTQPEYHITEGGKPPPKPEQERTEPVIEKRISEDDRTFGREYFTKDGDKEK